MFTLLKWSSLSLAGIVAAFACASPVLAQDTTSSPAYGGSALQKAESIELTCSGTQRRQFADSIASRAFKTDAKLVQTLACNKVLSSLLDSGLDLVRVKKDGDNSRYTLDGSAFAIVVGEIEPSGPLASINCNPSTNLRPWTCKCDTESHCLYLTLFCEHVDGDYYQCDEDESTASVRVDRALGRLIAGDQ